MPRNLGSTVDIASRRVCERDGLWYPLDELVVAGRALYCARPIAGVAEANYHERWLLPDHHWSVSRFRLTDKAQHRLDWYVEMDAIEVDGPLWRVTDGYLDVAVYEGLRYELWDADELGEGIVAGEISIPETALVLEAFDKFSKAIARHAYSGTSLLAEYAPGLPCGPSPARRPVS